MAAKIKATVSENLAIPISLVAILIVSGIAAAASISAQLRASVLTAAGFLEIWFLLWITNRF